MKVAKGGTDGLVVVGIAGGVVRLAIYVEVEGPAFGAQSKGAVVSS